MKPLERITARDNPLLQRIRKINVTPVAYRKIGQIWLEGDHLIEAAVRRGWTLRDLVLSESAQTQSAIWTTWLDRATRAVLVPDGLFKSISALDTPSRMGALIDCREPEAILRGAFSVVLDRVQDAGNVGSILRSAAAFGVKQVLALTGTAALWSPKVLRAGMGAHFGMVLNEGLNSADLAHLGVPWLATSSHEGQLLGQAPLPFPCVWVFGHEGQGVNAELMAACQGLVRIPQPGGEESLNVAAAAAICLFASAPLA